MDLRTDTGARILEVFWFDADRNNVGLLVADDRGNTWAGEWDSSEIHNRADLRAAAQVVIEDGRVERNATA